MPSSVSGPPSRSHERIGIFRVFGRDAGFTALYTAYVTAIRCVIPEYKVDLDKLIGLLVEEKQFKPEQLRPGRAQRRGRLGGLPGAGIRRARRLRPPQEGERRGVLADEIKRRTGEETMTSDLTYDLRSGEPDFVDKLVALTFGNMAYDAILEGKSGLMSALVKGCYDLVPIPDPKLGPRRLDVKTTYNTERYRPMYAHKRGLPVFLNRT